MSSIASRLGAIALFGVALMGAGGCARSKVDYSPQVAHRPAELRPLYIRLLEEGPVNRALNLDRIGYAAALGGHWPEAAEALDESIGIIETVYAQDRQAANARSLFKGEDKKIFKGEPYERMMVYALRGNLYLLQGDLSNARACFKSAQVQDAFSAESQDNCDFSLAYYMESFANYQMDKAYEGNELFMRACEAKPARLILTEEARAFGLDSEVVSDGSLVRVAKLNTRLPDPEGSNSVVIAWAGVGPVKAAFGQYLEKLTYVRAPNVVSSVRVTVDGIPQGKCSRDNLYYQAVTRGSRLYDEFLKQKATGKAVATVVGVTTMAAGAGIVATSGMSDNSGGQALAGLGVMLAGATIYGVGAAVNAKADTRCWEDIPEEIHFLPLKLAPGSHRVEINYLDAIDSVISSHSVEIQKSEGAPAVIFTTEKAVAVGGSRPKGDSQ